MSRSKLACTLTAALVLAGAVAAKGRRVRRGATYTPREREVYGRPGEIREGYGEGETKRTWIPGLEAIYQKARAAELGENHVLFFRFGVRGPRVYDVTGFYWSDGGPYTAVRAWMDPDGLVDRWREVTLDPSSGDQMVQALVTLDPFLLTDDNSLRRKRFGAGYARVVARRGSRTHEVVAYAPRDLPDFKDLHLVLEEFAPAIE